MSRKEEVWEAPPIYKELMPRDEAGEIISGNSINGLDETGFRHPSPFFWHYPQYHQFGAVQGKVLGKLYGSACSGPILKAFSVGPDGMNFVHRGPDPIEMAGNPVEKPAAEWSQLVKEFSLENDGDVVGITAMNQDWVFEGFELNMKNLVVIGVAHDYDEIKEAPSSEENTRAIQEVGRQYTRGAVAAAKLTNFILEQGYPAESFPGPVPTSLNIIPAAISAGLGELGKHGSLINRKLGSSFRLSAVATDMPLVPDEPDVFGADDFCHSCQVCSNACPPEAIYDDKQYVRGEKKWYVDFDKCIPYFGETFACGICIAVCPWSLPGVADGFVVKMAKRRSVKEPSGSG